MASHIVEKFELLDESPITLKHAIGRGNNGTMVYNGTYCFRGEVAIKCIKIMHKKSAIREIQILSKVDSHPNVVSHYGYKIKDEYFQIVLEQCNCTLQDFIFVQENFIFQQKKIENEIKKEEREKFQLIRAFCQANGVEMLNKKRIPTDHTFKLLRGILDGISYIHEQGIIHRDLTPENILLMFDQNKICPKISDFNISIPITHDPSFDYDNIGSGTYGWKAPELLNERVQTVGTDIFSFGCITFCCLTWGNHPSGDISERERNIKIGNYDISAISHIPEARDLLDQILHISPRLTLHDIKIHPFLWILEKRLHFLCIASDRVQWAKKNPSSLNNNILRDFNIAGACVFGSSWSKAIDASIEFQINRSNKNYRCDKLRDLLRLVRNMSSHYEQQPRHIQVLFRRRRDGIVEYFSDKFPNLFFEVFKIMQTYCFKEDAFHCFVI